MNNILGFKDQVICNVDRNRQLEDKAQLKGKFHVEHFDKDGKLLNTYDISNSITNAGKNSILGVMFHSVTQITAWYLGLINNVGWTAENVADTLASHTGWTEFSSYTGNRLAWGPDAASGQSITNSSAVVFPITASGVLKGIFLCSAATGTSGTLWATADFPSPITVSNGDNLRITYTVNA